MPLIVSEAGPVPWTLRSAALLSKQAWANQVDEFLHTERIDVVEQGDVAKTAFGENTTVGGCVWTTRMISSCCTSLITTSVTWEMSTRYSLPKVIAEPGVASCLIESKQGGEVGFIVASPYKNGGADASAFRINGVSGATEKYRRAPTCLRPAASRLPGRRTSCSTTRR